MTPKTRSPAEKTVVWSTTTARINSARRRRGSQVIVGPPCGASPAGRRSQHLHVVEAREVDQRLDEDVLLEVTACVRDLAHGADGDGGRERAVLLARRVDDLTLGHFGLGIDEVGAHRVAVAPLFSIFTPTPDSGSLMSSTVARSRETSSTRPTSPAPVTTGMSTPTPSLSPFPIWTVNSKLLGAPSTSWAAIELASSTNGRSSSFFSSLFSAVAARAVARCPRAASRRRRSRAFSSFSEAALVTPSIQSPTGENTVSNAPAIGLTKSCAPPRTAEIGPAPRTSSVMRVTAVRTISARIVRRRFPRWYTTTGSLAPWLAFCSGFQPPPLRRPRRAPAPGRSVAL